MRGEDLVKAVYPKKMNGPFDYMGLAEVAEFLGVSKQTICNWRSRNSFPEPVATLKATPIWRMTDIREWQKSDGDAGS